MIFDDIPDYYELNYNNYLYIISKFSFIPSEEIYFNWNEIHNWDDNRASNETLVHGETIIDAYSFNNQEVKSYIEIREELYKATKEYFKNKGIDVIRDVLGSEDGEYVQLENGSILYLLDPNAIEIWIKSQNVEDFLVKYKSYFH